METEGDEMGRKPLSNVDTAWLRMEDPTNLMMISGVMVFGGPIDFERLKATIEHRLLRWDRFRQRVVHPRLPLGTLYWEDDPDFDLRYHLQRAALPPPGDQAALQEAASLLASTQLDFSRPLWQMHLLDGYGEGCALVCRLHHSIGDGIALVHVLLSLTDSDPDSPWPVEQPKAPRQRRRGPLRRLTRPARSAIRATRQVSGALLREGMEVLAEPRHAMDLAQLATRGATALGRLVLLWPDPKTVFKGKLVVPKRAAWSEPIPLTSVKTIGRGLGGTVNDVLLTAMTGALRRYLQGRDEAVDGLNIRAIVPVNLRPPDVEPELGNKFGLVFLSLPVGIADPRDRLRELKRRMDALKGSLEAPVAFGILNTIGMAPEAIQDVVVNIFGAKGTAVMTNVVGPRERIYLAGAPLDALMFWVPQSGRLGMGVSILSYAGQVWMGVITDEGLVPDPEAIISSFHSEFDALLAEAREARKAPDIQELSAKLETVLADLDEMLTDVGVDSATKPDGDIDHCQALTKAGHPCKNRPLHGSRYCRVHQKP
jgi:WS/DGAT/MGAT family acyltransferase